MTDPLQSTILPMQYQTTLGTNFANYAEVMSDAYIQRPRKCIEPLTILQVHEFIYKNWSYEPISHVLC